MSTSPAGPATTMSSWSTATACATSTPRAEPLTYFRDLVADVGSRGESAMAQSHVFTVCRLALEAQRRAVRLAAKPTGSPNP